MLTWIDERILSIHQYIVDISQTWLGFNKFFFQKWSFLVWAFAMVHSIITDTMFESGLFIFGTIMLIWLTILAFVEIIRSEYEEAKFNQTGQIVYNKLHQQHLRVKLLLLCVLFTILEYLLSSIPTMALLTVHFYFSVCIPKPPSKNRLRKGYEKLLWKLNDWLEPEAQPA